MEILYCWSTYLIVFNSSYLGINVLEINDLKFVIKDVTFWFLIVGGSKTNELLGWRSTKKMRPLLCEAIFHSSVISNGVEMTKCKGHYLDFHKIGAGPSWNDPAGRSYNDVKVGLNK